MFHPCVKLLIKTSDTKMHQSNDYKLSSVFTPSGMISLDNNLQVGMIILLTSPGMQILLILQKTCVTYLWLW